MALTLGCASTPPNDEKDPWEGANRAVFEFNEKLDAWVAKPVAKGYRFIAPSFVETGVDNFFDNFLEVPNVLNRLLQGKWKEAGHDGSRLFLNTFAGLGGLVDVATEVGIEKNQKEDFGQTLQVWGVPKGPYVVLPVLGPSTVTDAAALPVNWYSNPRTYIPGEPLRYAITGLDYTNLRASLLDAEGLVNGDKYLFYREAYLQNREFLVKDGAVEDDFGGDLDDFDDF
ncbi:MAG TPA: VacJ family lipoprotein [Marinagarivorans sp.]